MIVFGTDHISVLQHGDSDAANCLMGRMDQATTHVVTTAATVEEQLRSWLSLINRYSDVRRQVTYYDRFLGTIRFFEKWQILRFDERAADEFNRLRSERVRIATTDLKIASIVLANDATLASSNLQDFERIPGLRIENWLTA